MHPILFQIGPITLYSYGLMIAIGFLVAIRRASQRGKAVGLDPGRIQTLGIVSLLCGLAGARAAYVALNWDLFRSSPWEIFRLDHGGLVFYGGLAAGFLGGLLTLRKFKLPIWPTVDLLIPSLVLSHAFGRIGCFLNGCCYGRPASLPWAVAFPFDGIPRHPTQLYEAAALTVLFVLLTRLPALRPGGVALTYGLLYGSWRFFIEFFRGDNPIAAGGLTVFQWISLPLALLCGWRLYRGWASLRLQ